MDNRLKGKVIVVTGAAQGIGRAYAEAMAREGAHVALCDINQERVDETARELLQQGLEASSHTVDITSKEATGELAEELGSRHGVVDGLVNNAAMFSSLELKPFWEIDVDEWDQVMKVNTRGTWIPTVALLPLLKKSEASSVVNIASDAVWMGKPGYLHYVASKGAVYGMTHAMARELGDFGIRVNSVSPGLVMTEVPRQTFTDYQRDQILASQSLKRFAETADIVGAVTFLLSEESRWITGQTIHVNGGILHR